MKEIKITDIKGFQVGQAENQKAGTGCTVILCRDGAVAGVDVRGGGPATRETDLLHPDVYKRQLRIMSKLCRMLALHIS